MKTKIEINLLPFDVPDFVMEKREPAPAPAAPALPESAARPIRHAITLHLKEMPAETLSKMCDEYRKEVFKKAGKTDPESIVKPTIGRHINDDDILILRHALNVLVNENAYATGKLIDELQSLIERCDQ